jgi:hypothetical protein
MRYVAFGTINARFVPLFCTTSAPSEVLLGGGEREKAQ